MGNALFFVCPHCGHEGEMSVIQTYVPFFMISPQKSNLESLNDEQLPKIIGRTRQRYCGMCERQYDTLEIAAGALDYLVARDILAENLVSLIRSLQTAPGSTAIDDPLRVEALGCLRVVGWVFGERFPSSWEATYPLSESECAIIICRVREAINSLGSEISDVVKDHFGVLLDDRRKVNPVDQETLQNYLSLLKNPSNFRKLRRISYFF